MTWVVLFIAGLLIGSFLNVIALRYTEGGSLLGLQVTRGRSHCVSCQVNLKWYELVPLFSFLVQGAKCRHCLHSLNWQYPIVELVTGILTFAIPWHLEQLYGPWTAANPSTLGWFYALVGVWLLVAYTTITLSAIDFRLRIIPDQSNLLLGIFGVFIIIFKHFNPAVAGSYTGSYATVLGGPSNPFLSALIAVLFSLALFGGIIYFSKGRGMGMGDLKLAIPIALLLGWPDTLIAFMAAFVIGAVVGLLLIFNKRTTMKGTVPFGPFLVLGVFVAMFYGESILRWYFGLI